MTEADRPSTAAQWLLGIPLFVIALGAAFTYVANIPDWPALAEMSSAPRGGASRLRDGPTVYRGRVRGPEDRVTPLGRPAAAYWWWLRTTGKNSRTVCFDAQRDGLVLESGDTTLSLALFGRTAGSELCLVSDERDDWACRTFVDVGNTPLTRQDATPPEAAQHCSAPEYQERFLPAGSDVEVLACAHQGTLVPCRGAVAAVVVRGTLDQHRRRRHEAVLQPVRFFGVASVVASIVVMLILSALSTKRNTAVGKSVKGPALS